MHCDLGDLAISYETYGTGRPIVMLPGRPSDHRIMARFMEPLFTQRDGWRRLYPDLPGTGLTPAVDRLATHDEMLEAMLAFLTRSSRSTLRARWLFLWGVSGPWRRLAP